MSATEVLTKEFELKELGNLIYFLDMEIRLKASMKIHLHLLKGTEMTAYKPDTPRDSTTDLNTAKETAYVENGQYQRLVGRGILVPH
ncbi:UNVERIFIED_CONTAM: hypothetical protein Slati_2637900 [Sesamum latifolium]|uniref:Uncharacterized protein n=1 Tax=Sesamum latifolium TaxID=2727402 RepID=A0AAW2VXB6_9LAMI